MPARSISQRRLVAIAKHAPQKVYKKNRDILQMGATKMHEFASTPEKNLPKRVKKGYGVGKRK